jgi:branched-subunit amino acid transport protein
MGSVNGWIAIACLAIGSFIIRYSFIGLLSGRTLSPGVAQTIRLAVPAILAALVVPLVVMSVNGARIDIGIRFGAGTGIGTGFFDSLVFGSRLPHLLAALVAGVIAWRRGGMFVPMAAGFATLYGLRALML